MSDPLWPRPTVTGQAPVWEAESETVNGQAPKRESAVGDTAEGVSVRHTPTLRRYCRELGQGWGLVIAKHLEGPGKTPGDKRVLRAFDRGSMTQ